MQNVGIDKKMRQQIVSKYLTQNVTASQQPPLKSPPLSTETKVIQNELLEEQKQVNVKSFS